MILKIGNADLETKYLTRTLIDYASYIIPTDDNSSFLYKFKINLRLTELVFKSVYIISLIIYIILLYTINNNRI